MDGDATSKEGGRRIVCDRAGTIVSERKGFSGSVPDSAQLL